MRHLLGLLAICALPLSMPAAASEQDDALQQAQDKMRASFSNAVVTDFRESPIPGIYEAYLVDKIIYYHPATEHLILGEIWSKDGRSLTAIRRAERASDALDQLPLEHALIVGPDAGTPIVEFTDPDCPYCRRYHAFAQSQAKTPIKRLIFFDTRAHPQAKQKAVHILCAADSQAALAEVYAGFDPEQWQSCPEGRRRAAAHAAIAKQAGVSVTPTLYVDRAPVLGFRQAVIEAYLARHSDLASNQGE